MSGFYLNSLPFLYNLQEYLSRFLSFFTFSLSFFLDLFFSSFLILPIMLFLFLLRFSINRTCCKPFLEVCTKWLMEYWWVGYLILLYKHFDGLLVIWFTRSNLHRSISFSGDEFITYQLTVLLLDWHLDVRGPIQNINWVAQVAAFSNAFNISW